MSMFSKSDRFEQELKWAKIWYGKFAHFHGRGGQLQWDFSVQDAISFLQSKRDQRVPAWKRMKILTGLLMYRRVVQERPIEPLMFMIAKLKSVAANERATEDGYGTIEDVVGKIDPKESDAIQQFRRALRKDSMKLQTERSYVGKVKAFMSDRGLTCLEEFQAVNASDVETHLTDLAVDGNVAASTQNAAFHGLLKFFTLVRRRDMGRIEAIRANKGKQIPTVLSVGEVSRIFHHLEGLHLTIAQLLYGCGLRISEGIRLRVKDLDFENGLIEIHGAKGGKSRLVPLPTELVQPLHRFVDSRRALHQHDLAAGTASVWLPYALHRKYPTAHRDFCWQYLFASNRLSQDPRTGERHRHHLHFETLPRHLKVAVNAASIDKLVTSHTFRHCFATHLLWSGTDIQAVQELLGHNDVKTTMIYTHVMNRPGTRVVSPLDRLAKDADPARADDDERNEVREAPMIYLVA